MYILNKTKNEYGGYDTIQYWSDPIPDGYYQVLDSFDFATFTQYNGFVNLTVKRNIVVSITPNTEAWEAWKAQLPEPEPHPGGSSDADAILNVLLGVTE